MDIFEAIEQRHSVRDYLEKEIEDEKIKILNEKIKNCNELSGLSIQLIRNEKSAFSGFFAKCSKFKNVKNYIAMVGKKSEYLDETVGYFGQKIVLQCQMLGLNTCWVGLKFITKNAKCVVKKDQKIVCLIAFGYGKTNGVKSKCKSFEKVTKIVKTNSSIDEWFKNGVYYALLAPTALNQQKFLFTLDGNFVSLTETGGVMSKVDLGIVKYHFEIGAGVENFNWR